MTLSFPITLQARAAVPVASSVVILSQPANSRAEAPGGRDIEISERTLQRDALTVLVTLDVEKLCEPSSHVLSELHHCNLLSQLAAGVEMEDMANKESRSAHDNLLSLPGALTKPSMFTPPSLHSPTLSRFRPLAPGCQLRITPIRPSDSYTQEKQAQHQVGHQFALASPR